MALDTFDTVKSTFGSLKTDAGMKILGLLFLVQLANMGSAYLGSMGTGAMVLSGLISLIAAIAMILITVGAFRSFDSGKVTSDQYTNNILWPVVRLTGANLVTTIFAYGLAVVALLPVAIVGLTAGAGVSSLGGASGAGILGAVLGLLGLLFGAAAFFYIFLMLTVSIPMIAVEDNRIFQALDRSVQRTKGEKVSMFLSAVPVILLYLVGLSSVIAAGVGAEQTAGPLMILTASAITAVTTTLLFSLLNEYHQRLPE